jgi:hypothetical protein
MNAEIIHHILSTDPFTRGLFQDFSTPDLPLPSMPKKPAMFILNTDSSKGPGIHWCLAIFNEDDVCEFFDPLGKSPETYNFHISMFNKCRNVLFNEYPVQSPLSSTCGHHCIFFAYHKARGLCLNDIMSKYSKQSLQWNDYMVNSFVHNNFGSAFAKIENTSIPYFL